MEQVRPAFSTESDMELWLQRQMEQVVLQFVKETYGQKARQQQSMQRIMDFASASPSTISFHDLQGILPASQLSPDQLRDDYISEKYGI